ncbi:MAG: diguanylate cyclase [Rhizobiaceae bacterium]
MGRTALGGIWTAIARSLRIKVLLLVLGGLLLLAIPAVFAFQWIIGSTTLTLGTLFAERQILYDRQRGLSALNREVALAETLSRSPVIKDWARAESVAPLRNRGLAELEHYREAFVDGSYFFVVDASGNYYFNDREGSYTGDQLRYRLSPTNPRDGWYYATSATGPGCQLNVDNDDELQVTKVWINCVVQKGDDVLGVVGTGIDLSTFIRNVVESDQTGVESLFVDADGAIQATRDASLIEFHSITREETDRRTIFRMLDREDDRAELLDMMTAANSENRPVSAAFMQVQGRKRLVGVGYLDQLGWYNVTVMDVDAIIDRRLFLPVGFLLLTMMAFVAMLAVWLFKRSVLDRLARAGEAITAVDAGDFSRELGSFGADEIGRMAVAINKMASSVKLNRQELEEAVYERTQQLESIAYLDPMCGVLNRRGAVAAFAEAATMSGPSGAATGFGLIDIDHFKEFNDTHGHRAGDAVVMTVAERLLGATRDGEFCARWGGDEFVVILPGCDEHQLHAAMRRIKASLVEEPVSLPDGSRLTVTVSIGACLSPPGEGLDDAAHRADMALYRAKRAGRNRWAVHDPERDKTRNDDFAVA